MNVTLVSASDDPLFSPSKPSSSTRTSTVDPLSRTSSPSSPLDGSNSTPVRRTQKTNGNSIFGDIDVSKLNGTSNGSGGLYNTTGNRRTSNTSLRSSNTLRSSRPLEDEEDLFGGGRVRSRVLSKATTPTSSTTSSVHKSSPPTIHSSLPDPLIPTTTITSPPPRHATPPPPPPAVSSSSPPQQVRPKPTIHQTTTEEKPTSSSFFASASRFFKSSNNSTNNSKPSSSASSIASQNNVTPSPKLSEATPPKVTTREAPTPPPSRPQQQQQQKKMMITPPSRTIEPEQVEEEDDDHVIEDEATRAFADDVISFQPRYQPDYAGLPSSEDISSTLDTLRLDNNKRLLPSASTPTTVRVEDPWFDNQTTLMGPIEPSISSPLRVSVNEIEPQKRTAFADLITSWNTGQQQTNTFQKEDPDQFFSHVAEEQRDIGFAGISVNDDDLKRRNVSIVWDNHEENPWN